MSRKNRIIIPCRIAYLNCWKPTSTQNGDKYSLVALISKSDKHILTKIEETIEYVKGKSIDKWNGKIPPNFHSPLHDGDIDKPDNPVFKNCYYLNAKCKDAPQIVDQNVEPIIDSSELYSGCYGNISIIFYGYNRGGNKGIAVWLGNIQKLKDGPRLSGRIAASEEFKPITYEEMLEQEDS